VGDLLNKRSNQKYIGDLKEDYSVFRDKFLKRTKKKEYLSITEARANKYKIDWSASEIIKPNQLGIQVLDQFDLKKLVPYIDWTPFFRSWDLHGKYPAILEDEVVGEQAQSLFDDAQELLQKVLDESQYH